MSSLLLRVLALLAVGVVSFCAVIRHQRGVFCGSQLSEALSLACNSNYFIPRDTRSIQEGFLGSERALSFMGRGRRQHRGVVDECCHKPCSMQQLRAYCAN